MSNPADPIRLLERRFRDHESQAMNVVMSQELPNSMMLEAVRDDSGRQQIIDVINEQSREVAAREKESLELVRESVELARRSEERALKAEDRVVRAEEREQRAEARSRRANFISWCALLVAVASLVFTSIFFWLSRVP